MLDGEMDSHGNSAKDAFGDTAHLSGKRNVSFHARCRRLFGLGDPCPLELSGMLPSALNQEVLLY